MPPKPSTAPTAKGQAAVEPVISELSVDEGQEHWAGEGNTSAAASKNARRRCKQRTRRSKKSKATAAEDADSTTTDGVTEIVRTGEAELGESNDFSRRSPPSDTDSIATEPHPRFQFGRGLPQLPRAPYVEVPVVAHYELRELPSVGEDVDDNDEGLFATQKIEQGTRIISERPLFTLPAPGDQVPELMAAYENLPKSDQETIWNLRPAVAEASPLLMNLRFLTDRLAMDLQNIMCKSEAARAQEKQATLVEMQPKLVYAMNVYRVAARWHANRCSLLEIPVEQRADVPNGTPITGLFIGRAHIRHSCVPNCFASYDANLGRMNVHVTRDIAPGEELTLSSFADNMYYSNAEDRKEELFTWGLTCNCEACNEKLAKFQVHEAARQRAHSRVLLLNDVLTRLEKEELPEVAPLISIYRCTTNAS